MIIPERMPITADMLGVPLNPADLVGGIRVEGQDGPGFHWEAVSLASTEVDEDGMPVADWEDPEYGHRLWEYRNAQGDVRGCVLEVPANRSTPAWKIHETAGDYVDVSRVISGSGQMAIASREGYGKPVEIAHDLNRTQTVHAGDTFQISAGPDGVAILSLNPRVAFHDDLETRVDSLF